MPTMESKLRKLYMRVHPDLLNSLPVAKKTNEKSFQNLSNFLETLKQSEYQASNEKFVLEFYLRPKEHSGQLKMEDLEHFKMTVQGGGSEFEKLMELGKLFEKCGLGADFKMKNKSAFRTASDLERFLAQVGEEAAMNKMRMDSQWRDIIVHQHMLHRDKGLRVSFMCADHDSPELQVSTFEKLQSEEFSETLANLSVELRQIVIGHCNGLDAEGRIMLHPASSVPEWLRHISSIDWAASYSRKAKIRTIREQERAAARRLGLTFVHAREEVEHESSYHNLLASLARESGARSGTSSPGGGARAGGPSGTGPVSQHGGRRGEEARWGGERRNARAGGLATRDGQGRKAVLLVQKTVCDSEEGVALLGRGCGIDEVKGTLLAPVHCPAEHVIGLVERHADAAAQIREQFEKRRQHISALLSQARAVLGAAGIEVDWEEGVSEEDAAVCLDKLMAGASSNTSMGGLAKHTAGMHILIGNQYQLRPDGVVVVPFDFNL